MAPVGQCTAGVEIHAQLCPVNFFVLENCPGDIILGQDFCYECGSIIDLGSNSLTLLKLEATQSQPTPDFTPASVLDELKKLFPLPSIFMPVKVCRFPDGEALLGGSIKLLLEKWIGVARGLLQLYNERVRVLDTNLRNEP